MRERTGGFYPPRHYAVTVTTSDRLPETATTLTRPSPSEAVALVEAGLDRGDLVTLFGRCTVEYDGRVRSSLAAGDRHVMCKPDGTVLVHAGTGQRPVNWLSSGSVHTPTVSGGRLELASHRPSTGSELTVAFETVESASAFPVASSVEPTVVGTEEDLRQRVLGEPSLVEPGFRPLATERETAAGAVDIYGTDGSGAAVAVELKRRRAGPDAVGQLNRYVEALRRDLHAEATVRGILVAPSVTDRARRLLAANGLEYVSLGPDGGSLPDDPRR